MMRFSEVPVLVGALAAMSLVGTSAAHSATGGLGVAQDWADRAAAVACHGGAYTVERGESPRGASPLATSSEGCDDVAVRMTQLGTAMEARVCLHVTNGEPHCEPWRTVDTVGWTVLAEDVVTGTTYWAETRGGQPGLHYQLAH